MGEDLSQKRSKTNLKSTSNHLIRSTKRHDSKSIGLSRIKPKNLFLFRLKMKPTATIQTASTSLKESSPTYQKAKMKIMTKAKKLKKNYPLSALSILRQKKDNTAQLETTFINDTGSEKSPQK